MTSELKRIIGSIGRPGLIPTIPNLISQLSRWRCWKAFRTQLSHDHLSPPSAPPLNSTHLVLLKGAVARRCDWRDGVRCPCGLLTHSGARGGVGLPPGPLRGPARSWLTTVGSMPNAFDRLSRCARRRNGEEAGNGNRIAGGIPIGESGAGHRITPQKSMR